MNRTYTGIFWDYALSAEARRYAMDISHQYGMSYVLTCLLLARGIEPEDFIGYLDPKIRDLIPNPKYLKNMPELTDRIIEAIENKEKILIYGDYDVDGACSAAILYKYLSNFGLDIEVFIPNRILHGYGLNQEVINKFLAKDISLIIAVDCGSNGNITAQGTDILVLDHHKVIDANQAALAIVNCNQPGDNSGCGYLCAAGVTFMAIVALNSQLKQNSKYKDKLRNAMAYLDLVALATICDVVPLTGLNRALVKKGLLLANMQKNIALNALAYVLGINQPFDSQNFAFSIGPNINAAGRIDDSSIGFRLFVSQDPQQALTLAKSLVEVNKKRQLMESQGIDDILFRIDSAINSEQNDAAIVEIGNWHPGILGLLASRLCEKYSRPAFIASSQGDNLAVGSARSVRYVDISNIIMRAIDNNLLVRGGGHAMAAGFTVEKEKFSEFANWVKSEVEYKLGKGYEKPVLKVEHVTKLQGINIDLYNEIELAGPYGCDNSRPLIMVKDAIISFAKKVGKDHVMLRFSDSYDNVLKAIAFRSANSELGQYLLNNIGKKIDLIGTVHISHYNNFEEVQFQLADIVISDL